ncbi:MAG: hypothetical protein IMZ75_16865, partial [Actinobacteria bacterium]|nr:hypothetical protein [Actinomycetota bacterium]
MGMLTSGFVVAKAAQPSTATAGTVKPRPITASQPVYTLRWMPSTAYTRGQQVVNPNNDVVSANLGHTSSATYASDVTKWTISSTFATALVNGAAPVRQGDLSLNVKNYGVKGDGITDDTAAIQAVLAAVPAKGAAVFFPAGNYLVPNGGLTCESTVTLTGVPGLDGTGSRIITTATNTTALTLDGAASVVSGLSFIHTTTGTRSAGLVGLSITNSNFTRVEKCFFQGWSTCLQMISGIYYTVTDNSFRAFVVAGLDISSPVNTDSGDMSITCNSFDRGSDTATGGSAVLWRSGGGLRFTSNKINGGVGACAFADGVRLSVADGATTGILLVNNNSIENFSARGIAVEKAGTTGVFGLGILVAGNEIATYGA